MRPGVRSVVQYNKEGEKMIVFKKPRDLLGWANKIQKNTIKKNKEPKRFQVGEETLNMGQRTLVLAYVYRKR